MKPGISLRHSLGLITCTLLLALTTGCVVFYSTPVQPPMGFLFQETKAPLTVNATGNPCGPQVKKFSQSSTQFFCEPIFTRLSFASDEAAIAQIAKKGGISKVSYADYELKNILGVYAKFTINVYGE